MCLCSGALVAHLVLAQRLSERIRALVADRAVREAERGERAVDAPEAAGNLGGHERSEQLAVPTEAQSEEVARRREQVGDDEQVLLRQVRRRGGGAAGRHHTVRCRREVRLVRRGRQRLGNGVLAPAGAGAYAAYRIQIARILLLATL